MSAIRRVQHAMTGIRIAAAVRARTGIYAAATRAELRSTRTLITGTKVERATYMTCIPARILRTKSSPTSFLARVGITPIRMAGAAAGTHTTVYILAAAAAAAPMAVARVPDHLTARLPRAVTVILAELAALPETIERVMTTSGSASL